MPFYHIGTTHHSANIPVSIFFTFETKVDPRVISQDDGLFGLVGLISSREVRAVSTKLMCAKIYVCVCHNRDRKGPLCRPNRKILDTVHQKVVKE